MGDSNAYILGTDQEELKRLELQHLSGPLNPMWGGEHWFNRGLHSRFRLRSGSCR